MLTEMQASYNIKIYLDKIDFTPIEEHSFNLYEYLKFELYGIDPSYLVDCNEEPFKFPKYFKWVLKGIKDLGK
jgi:hypothetical protein